jgi:hypothetical protein
MVVDLTKRLIMRCFLWLGFFKKQKIALKNFFNQGELNVYGNC